MLSSVSVHNYVLADIWNQGDFILFRSRASRRRMGFPAFTPVVAGVFPILLVNMSLSIAAIMKAFMSVYQAVRFGRNSGTNEMQSFWTYTPHSRLYSGSVVPTMWDEIRSSLPVICYDPAIHNASSQDGEACAVCLSEFEKGVDILQLPRCNHVFHRECVHKWLDHQQTTCPMCRCSLVSDDLTTRYMQRERELAEELILWYSNFHGSGLHGLWWQD